MMPSKGQVYAKNTVDFISKKEGPVYFEHACMCFQVVKLGFFLTLSIYAMHVSYVSVNVTTYTPFYATKGNLNGHRNFVATELWARNM